MTHLPTISRRRLLQVSAAGALLAPLPGFAATSATDRETLAVDAYIWGFPRVLLSRYLDLAQAAKTPFNQFFVAGVLATPADKVAGPNVDTLYGYAWLDVGKEPVVLRVPDTDDRYYSIQLIDGYANSFAYVGRRATGTQAGGYAITGPGWSGHLPDGVKAIAAPTRHVLALTRTLVTGPADLAAARKVQDGYGLVELSRYPVGLRYPVVSDHPLNALPILDLSTLGASFFDRLNEALASEPPFGDDQADVQRFKPLGLGSRRRPSHDPAWSKVLAAAVPVAEQRIRSASFGSADFGALRNGWLVNLKAAPVITDPLVKAAFNHIGPGGHIADEALYFFWRGEPSSPPLSGANRYALKFPANGTPPVGAFWSLTVYGADWALTANPIDRYAIGDRTAGLKPGADGSLELQIQHDRPADVANWLPVPAGPFSLVLRTYQPSRPILDGQYVLPPLATL
jgi:hypothetical protein